MKKQAALLLFIVTTAYSSAQTARTTLNPLNGTWKPIEQEFSGDSIPHYLFEKQKLALTDSTYTATSPAIDSPGERVDKGTIKVTENKIDIYGTDGPNKGKHYTAIYKIENNQLIICYNLKGDGYPENFQTKGKKMYFKSVFKRD